MRIVVNHLTRMQPGYICVAGVDTRTRLHIRPVLSGRLTRDLLTHNGGPFDMACEVELGSTVHIGTPPEVEDYRFDSLQALHMGTPHPNDFWKMLSDAAVTRLVDIFGLELTQTGSSCIIQPGFGKASLGCLIPTGPTDLFLRQRLGRSDQIRARLNDGKFDVDLSVTDIRLYEADHVTPNRSLVLHVAQRLKERIPIILSVGLTRPFASSPSLPPVHWLQVNNLHFEDNPTWQLG